VTDVFDQNTDTPQVHVSSDPFADKLKTIVNDNGQPKYESVDKALDALTASQAHIKKLEDEAKAREQELQKSREEAMRATTLEEIVQRLAPKNKTPDDPLKTVNVEETIAKKVQDALGAQQQKATADAKGLVVRNALVNKFGDVEKTRDAIAAKAAELGMSVSALQSMSTQSPKAVLALFGVQAPASSAPTTPTSTPLNPVVKSEPLKAPEQSLISGPGATDKNRKEMMAKIREEIYKKYEVTTA
jgi:hypothetical protein